MPTRREKVRSLVLVVAIYVVALGAGLAGALVLPSTNLLVAALIGDLIATLIVFISSRVAGNSSLYDPYWSVAPPGIAAFWIVTLASGAERAYPAASRIALAVVSAALLVWAVRLTANWVRRWRGTSDEDWRYEMLKGKLGRFDWFIDVVGIHLFPTLQVFLGMVPFFFFVRELVSGRPAWAPLVAGAVVMLGAVALESTADRQLARFRSEGGTGLLTSGVWGVFRHPNYLGEILFWWGLWAASLSAGIPMWTVAGPLAMTALFLFISIPMMDRHLEQRSGAPASN